MAAKKLYTVGPNAGYVGHKVDKKNYFPGETFNLDHLDAETIKKMIASGAVVEVKETPVSG